MSQSRLSDDRGVWRKALVTVPLIVGTGFLMGYVSNSGFDNGWYAALEKPGFQPPGWAFGLVWSVLYVMIGLSLALILNLPSSEERMRGLSLFAGQMLLNFAWSPIFFGAHAIDIALLVIIVTTMLTAATIVSFRKLRPLAAALLLPYLLWLCLATALNYETGRLNRGAGTHPLGITGA
ncbi:MAG: TspO/MBR family protein [Sphingomicrobium sp.]